MIVERLERTIERSTAASSATVTKGRDDEGSPDVKLCPRSDPADSVVPDPCDPPSHLMYLVSLSIESSSEFIDFLCPIHINVHRSALGATKTEEVYHLNYRLVRPSWSLTSLEFYDLSTQSSMRSERRSNL